jgi:hypothetical protein
VVRAFTGACRPENLRCSCRVYCVENWLGLVDFSSFLTLFRTIKSTGLDALNSRLVKIGARRIWGFPRCTPFGLASQPQVSATRCRPPGRLPTCEDFLMCLPGHSVAVSPVSDGWSRYVTAASCGVYLCICCRSPNPLATRSHRSHGSTAGLQGSGKTACVRRWSLNYLRIVFFPRPNPARCRRHSRRRRLLLGGLQVAKQTRPTRHEALLVCPASLPVPNGLCSSHWIR